MKTNHYTIVNKVLMLLPLCLFTFLPFSLSAQTFTQRIQNKGTASGTIVIHQSDSIDQLVNSAKLGPTSTSSSSQATSSSSQTTNSSSQTTNSSSQATSSSSQTTNTTNVASETTPTNTDYRLEEETAEQPTTTKKVMRGYKVNGYRVQAFAGGNSRKDRQQAERIGNEIKAQFNNVPVYVHFYSPRWICRVGNFRTYEEAHQMLIGLRKMGFSQATIVKGKITVPY